MSIEQVTALPDTAIEAVAELQRRATHVEPFTVDREPNDVYFLRKPDGTAERVVAEPKPLDDKLATPSELASYIRDLEGRDRKPADGIVRIFPNGVVYDFDFDNRRHAARVPLVQTPAFKAVAALAGENYQGKLLSQVDVYRLLRVTLRDCLPHGSNLPALIREMKFENGQQLNATIEQSRKNLGLAITGSVAGANGADMPESFTVDVSVFENFTLPVSIVIDLDPQPADAKLRLTPYPGQIERAMRDTLARIRDVFDTTTRDVNAKPLCPAYIAQ